MKTLPPRIFQLALLSIVAIHFLIPVGFIYDSPIRFIGLFPILAGCYLNVYTDRLIKKYETTIKPFEKPTSLIVGGPFRYSRNPIYLGMVLIVFGGSLLSGSVLSLIVPVAFALLIHFLYIINEEFLLEESFGEAYLNYKSNVRCWI